MCLGIRRIFYPSKYDSRVSVYSGTWSRIRKEGAFFPRSPRCKHVCTIIIIVIIFMVLSAVFFWFFYLCNIRRSYTNFSFLFAFSLLMFILWDR